ncbi:hypothetical protein ITJ86_15120 [Winogradskyella sp. F6397]|uniref:HNH endonuclease n=1 Tax=Winogradskyella marina TaxID=2785530 RepID=A0ABS0ELE4_9FLAO|nr:hypothetical protein [Winogradskyella marina]MBF8151239.1 hypothetical protein [Winogradskyella marina]
MYSVEEVRENYKRFPDAKIEKIARNESKGLRKEILTVLKDEIIRRQLNRSLISWVDSETQSFTGLERQSLIRKIQNQRCVKCSEKRKLYGFETHTVKSFLIGMSTSRNEQILCKPCGKQEKLNAIVMTFFAGWWSAKGFLLTPFTIFKDVINFLFIEKISDRILNGFVDDVTGSFRRYGTDDNVIYRLIKWKNKSDDN